MVLHPMILDYLHLYLYQKNRRKSGNISNNYRAIALSSIMGKLLDHLLLSKYHNVFNTSDLQYGFKKKHGTAQCTFVVNEIIQYYMNNDSNVYVTLLDSTCYFVFLSNVNYVQQLLDFLLCYIPTSLFV